VRHERERVRTSGSFVNQSEMRGMMLIALNIGYDMGILSRRIFTMLVIMALVTTIMTGPLLALLDTWRERRNSLAPQPILSGG